MKPRELLLFTFWISIPMVIILSLLLTGCTPLALQETEIAAEGVEEVVECIEKEKQLKVTKNEASH